MLDELIEKLEVVEDNRNKVITKVYRASYIYTGDYLSEAPDLIIGFNKGYRMGWKTAIGGFDTEVLLDNEKKWKDDHLVDPMYVPGALFTNQKYSGDSASQLDIAPTILNFFGIENNMEGYVLK